MTSPAAEVAVADWLDAIAESWEFDTDLMARVGGDQALSVALAYLGVSA